jgi:TolB-like protein/Tfp pilus assembly protein PilF
LPLSSGTQLGPYTIIAAAGTGGMGEVYKAIDTRLDRLVAIKILPPKFATDPALKERFTREARAIASLSHPNICRLFDIGHHDGTDFLVLEFLEGETLERRLEQGPLPLDEALRIAIQVADALATAHASGIIHRDLKPANVMLTKSGARLLDFGLARTGVAGIPGAPSTLPTAPNLTLEGYILGTLQYMAPEQLEGRHTDHRTDIFAFGSTLYEMVTGRKAFAGRSQASVIGAILKDMPPPASAVQPLSPPALDSILATCLAKAPDARWQSATDLRNALTRALEGTAPVPVRPGRLARLAWPLTMSILALAVVAAALTTAGVRVPFLGGIGRSNVAPAAPASVAVLPFASFSQDKEDEYFADGLTEEVINSLAQLPELKVAARTSVFYFKGRNEDLRDVGRRLGVSHVIEGSVRRDGQRLRVVAQLIKVADGFHIWSRSYEHMIADTLAIQTGIADAVAEALELKLLARTGPARERDPEAVKLELTARALMRQLGREEITTARERFRQLTEREPDNAAAWAGLAHATTLLLQNYMALRFEDASSQTTTAIDRALKLDPKSVDAWIAKGWADYIVYFRGGDVRRAAAADVAFKQALSLDPRNPDALTYYAVYLNRLGRVDEAVDHARRAIELDPLNRVVRITYGVGLAQQGKRADAEREYRSLIDLDPEFPDPKINLAELLVQDGRLAEAEPWLRAAVDKADPTTVLPLYLLYLNLGLREDADRVALDLDSTDIGKRVRTAIPLLLAERDRDVIAFADAELAKGEDPFWHSVALTAAVMAADWPRVRREIGYVAPALLLPQAKVDRTQLNEALIAAALFDAERDRAQRDHLLRAVLAAAAPRPGTEDANETRLVRVKAHAALGERDQALTELKGAVAAGYRTLWNDDLIRLERDPALSSLRNDSAFKEIVAGIDADLRRQRDRVLASRR